MSWPPVSLGDVCHFVRGPFGGSLKKEIFRDEGYAVFEQQHAINDQFSEIRYFVDEAKFVEMKRFELLPGDLIMSCSGTMGKVAVVPNGVERGIINQALLKISPQEHVDVKFLRYWMESDDFQRQLTANTSGAAIRNVASVGVLKELTIPLPPLDEQRRIAGILDQADALRRLRTRALDKLNTLGQAIFHEMFGDPATNPKGWATAPLGELGRLDRGVSKHRPRNNPALLGGEHPLIQTGDVARAGDYIENFEATYSDLGLQQSKKWPSGTLCITIAANIADTAILGFDACFPDSVVGFNSGSDAFNFFTHRWFATVKAHLERIAPAAAQKNINLAILRDLPVIKPSTELVTLFYEREKELRAQKVIAAKALVREQSLFAALQHRAFRGEL